MAAIAPEEVREATEAAPAALTDQLSSVRERVFEIRVTVSAAAPISILSAPASFIVTLPVAVRSVNVPAAAEVAPSVVPSMAPPLISTLVITTEPVPLGVIVISILASVPSAARVVPVRVTPAAATLVSKVKALIVPAAVAVPPSAIVKTADPLSLATRILEALAALSTVKAVPAASVVMVRPPEVSKSVPVDPILVMM